MTVPVVKPRAPAKKAAEDPRKVLRERGERRQSIPDEPQQRGRARLQRGTDRGVLLRKARRKFTHLLDEHGDHENPHDDEGAGKEQIDQDHREPSRHAQLAQPHVPGLQGGGHDDAEEEQDHDIDQVIKEKDCPDYANDKDSQRGGVAEIEFAGFRRAITHGRTSRSLSCPYAAAAGEACAGIALSNRWAGESWAPTPATFLLVSPAASP